MLQKLMIDDLKRSGLKPINLYARIIEGPEAALMGLTSNVKGYVIPYFDLEGNPTEFFRCRLFEKDLPKYLQPKATSNKIYFPKGFWELLEDTGFRRVLLTEGEKKAALAVKLGYACVAVGGVDSWKTRSIVLPSNTVLSKTSGGKVIAKMPPNSEVLPHGFAGLASGFQELIDLCVKHNTHFHIIYDSDNTIGVQVSVQRAAASLGFELRYRGLPYNRVHQIFLPTLPNPSFVSEKIGLDDYFMYVDDPTKFKEVLRDAEDPGTIYFPVHPNIKEFVNRKIELASKSRKKIIQLAIAVLSNLDNEGRRLFSKGEQSHYYFENKTKTLMRVELGAQGTDIFDVTSFGKFLYRVYGVSKNDSKLIAWLSSLFAGEGALAEVKPHRVLATPEGDEDYVSLQINNGQYITISADGLEIHDNGSNEIMFEVDQVEPVDAVELESEFLKQQLELASRRKENPKAKVIPWWRDVLEESRLDEDKTKKLLTYLYYISPFLYRWRGTQLPMEIITGEAGSGKSSLCEMRLNVLTGSPKLRNAPATLKDWSASVASTGGLHVIDNVVFADATLRQKLSDEICRLITESKPSIEMRKLYANSELYSTDVNVVFAFTSIGQPFHNTDLLQRSIVSHFDKGEKALKYDSRWGPKHIAKRGGRIAWLAHHLLVLQEFFKKVRTSWNEEYLAKHRLVNFEQILLIVSDLFESGNSWIPEYLQLLNGYQIEESDIVLKALKEFSAAWLHTNARKSFGSKEIVAWMSKQGDYFEHPILSNSRSVGRYIKQRRNMLAMNVGIISGGVIANRQTYYAVNLGVDPINPKKQK